MSANDIFADAAELDLDLDLALLESLRWARKEFGDRICEASESRAEDVLATLRLEATISLPSSSISCARDVSITRTRFGCLPSCTTNISWS